MNWFSMIHGLDDQKYERYLPTAFDSSLTLLEKVNKVIETLNQIVAGVNTVADYVDGHVNTQNEKIQQLRDDFEILKTWLESEGLQEQTVWVLNEWFDSGRLAQIINNDVLNMKVDTVTFEQFVLSTTAQLQQNWINVKHPPAPLQPADSSGLTDSAMSLNAIARYCEENNLNMRIPAGRYVVSQSFIPPKNVKCHGDANTTYIVADADFCETDKAVVVKLDCENQPIYDLGYFQIQTEKPTLTNGLRNNVIGLQVGGNRNSLFENITITSCWGGGVLLYAENIMSADMDNFTFKHIWTVQSGNSLVVKANGDIARGNITGGRFVDCIFTTDDTPTFISAYTPITISGAPDKLIYGITFNQCFTQPRHAPIINMEANSGGVYNINFDNVNTDYWGQAGFGDEDSDIPSIILEGVRDCVFKNIITPGISDGYMLINSSYNTFIAPRFHVVNSQKNTRFFNIDGNSFDNKIIAPSIVKENYLENITSIAHSAQTIFGVNDPGYKVIFTDSGVGTTISNSVFKNTLKLLNDPNKLFKTSDGIFTDYPNAITKGDGVVISTLPNGNLQIYIPTNTPVDILFPLETDRQHAGVHFKYKATYAGGNVHVGAFGFNKQLIKDDQFREMTFIVDTKQQNFNNFHLYVLDGDLLDSPVIIEVEKWEISEGYNLPYAPNYTSI